MDTELFDFKGIIDAAYYLSNSKSDEEINNMVLCWSSMILHDKGVIKENYDIRYLPLGL